MILVSAAEMRQLDRLTIDQYGVPGYTLMERAGRGATDMLLETFPHVRGRRVLVVAGKGNNGGDGFIVARLLRAKRVKVDVVLLAPRVAVQGDAAKALAAYLRARGAVHEVVDAARLDVLKERLEEATLVVDAILGTGLSAPVEGMIGDAIEMINSSGVPVFAIDIPSGLDSDRGIPLGAAVQAEATATFGFPKIGQLVFPGATHVGVLGVVDIGIAAGAVATVNPRTRLLAVESVARLLPRRAPEAHKGSGGHVAVVAGSRGHTGAALMAAHACCRIGVGLTTLAGPASLNTIFSLGRPEVMTAALPDDGGEVAFDEASLQAIVGGRTAIVVGPGLGTHRDAQRVVYYLIETSHVPIVLDADALTCVARDLSILRRANAALVLTPHPGEMARLVGGDSASVQRDRVGVARRFAMEHGCTVALKGARTVIAAASGEVWINPTGNPGMASGGMGDALAGMVGGLLAQGVAPADAACAGVYLHGAIADRLAETRGPIGFLAGDVIEAIPNGLQDLLRAPGKSVDEAGATGSRKRRVATRRGI